MKQVLFRTHLDHDLRPLSAALWDQRIPHRVAEEDGGLVVELAPQADHDRAREILELWKRGGIHLEPAPRANAMTGGATASSGFLSSLRSAPVTSALIALGMLGFALVYFGAPISLVSLLTYEPFSIERGAPVFGETSTQYWRLVTPVFLHFGWLHITFNALWCWEVGKRIESVLGSLNLAGLFLLTAVVGNVSQHLWVGSALFGGLSGVVYGLLGFSFCAGRVNPAWASLSPPPAIMLFMVGWLAFCLLDVSHILGFSVANAAHLGGLLSGSLAGVIFGLTYRQRSSSDGE